MASPENTKWWKESERLKAKNKRRSERRKANPRIQNPRSKSNKKENE
jgi:hypothetical protein